MRAFSDYIVFVDESGDHSLSSIDPHYPMFVLAFCIIEKSTYVNQIVPAIQRIKFRHFGHDMVVFHESAIRKAQKPFNILLNADTRSAFMADLNETITHAPFSIVASCIRKRPFLDRRGDDLNPYHVAMEFGLERVFMELQARGQRGKLTHVVFERRGRKEDADLELEFLRIQQRTRMKGLGESLSMVFAEKATNTAGLQLADMVARPIGRYLLEPEQPNRAFEIIEPKIRRSPSGDIDGWGLKCYP